MKGLIVMKEKIKNLVAKINEKKVAVAAGVVPVAASALAVGASAAEGETGGTALTVPLIGESISAGAFNGILDQMVSVVPVVLPVVVACLAFKKGIYFLKSMIAGA